MLPQGVLECVSEYSDNVIHGHWMKCSKAVNQKNKQRLLDKFRHSISERVNEINTGVMYILHECDWLKFIKNPNDGLRFKIRIDLQWMSGMIDSDDEDWVGGAFEHLEKIGEQAEGAMDELKYLLSTEKIKHSIEMNDDSLIEDLVLEYCSEIIEQLASYH